MNGKVDSYLSHGCGHPRYAKVTKSPPLVANQSVVILAENLNRLGLILVNASGSKTWINFAPSGNNSDAYCKEMAANSEWELLKPIYRGVISAYKGSGTGFIICTELQEYRPE